MFGAYQAGVWQELERRVRPGIVVGASVGSLNGWMIAGGATGTDLIEAWLGLGRPGMLRRSAFDVWIGDVYGSRRPRIAFGLVATELPSLQPRLFRSPDVDARHLAGACAIPFVLSRQKIGARWYCDGGLMLPLPLWAAIEMGATDVIAVNLLAVRPPLVEAAARAVQTYCGFRYSLPASVRVVTIEPTGRLGTMRDSITWTLERTKRLIEMGREDTRRMLPAIDALSAPDMNIPM
jgi:predicted acylesterase/phospholipase RssA